MSRPAWLPATDVPLGRVLPFPSMDESQAAVQSELGGALTFASADNLILQATQNLAQIVRLAHSLSEDQLLTLLGDLLSFKIQRLDAMQLAVERHRAFLSDLSAKQMRKRRRRQKRVKQDIQQIA